jgi:hypothetical protein
MFEEMNQSLKNVFDLVPDTASFRATLVKAVGDNIIWQKDVRLNPSEEKGIYKLNFNFPSLLTKVEDGSVLRLESHFGVTEVRLQEMEDKAGSLTEEIAFYNFSIFDYISQLTKMTGNVDKERLAEIKKEVGEIDTKLNEHYFSTFAHKGDKE